LTSSNRCVVLFIEDTEEHCSMASEFDGDDDDGEFGGFEVGFIYECY